MADSVIRFDIATEGECNSAQPVDLSLVDGLRRGAESAYEQLLTTYQQPVYNLVCRLLSDPNDAADTVQDVFLKVFRKIGSFRGESSLKTWIYRIAVNEAQNRRRWFWRHRRQEVELEPVSEDLRPADEYFADRGTSPFEMAASTEALAIIESALADLSPQFRTAVVLRDVEDLSYEEIAQVLEINIGTVKSRILRGREALRQVLMERLSAPSGDPAGTPGVLGIQFKGLASGKRTI